MGCGLRLTDEHLEGEVRALHGIDIAESVVEQARQRNPWAEYEVYDGATIPFVDELFDVTFAICVLHHVEPARWTPFVEELARVTIRDVLLVLLEHNPLNPLTRLAFSRCEFDEDVVLLRAGNTRRLVAKAGCAVAEARYIAFFPWRGSALRFAEGRLGRLPIGAQYAIVGSRA